MSDPLTDADLDNFERWLKENETNTDQDTSAVGDDGARRLVAEVRRLRSLLAYHHHRSGDWPKCATCEEHAALTDVLTTSSSPSPRR
jgi:hypothetical protein